jgi:Ca2+-binding EF-hand superfamily protein
MKQIREFFKRFDLNADGVVSVNELNQVMEKIGRPMTQKQLEDLVKTSNCYFFLIETSK